jgi:hypothetical protein
MLTIDAAIHDPVMALPPEEPARPRKGLEAGVVKLKTGSSVPRKSGQRRK